MGTETSQLGDERLLMMLSTALGPEIEGLLEDPKVVEVLVNPDGKLWSDRLGEGRVFTGTELHPASVERVISLVATAIGTICTAAQPLLAAELPGSGYRLQGVLPPISQGGPTLAIRKKASAVFSLDQWVANGFLSKEYRDFLEYAVTARKNIVVAGGTGSGKTTFTNALLDVVARCNHRVHILEDTSELQCKAEDCVRLRSQEGVASLRDLLKTSLRLRPDRIIVGEVRDGAALEFIRSLNTGHPGGICTIHADSAQKAMLRLEQLVAETGTNVSPLVLADAVNVVVFIEKTPSGRTVKEVFEVCDHRDGRYVFRDPLQEVTTR